MYGSVAGRTCGEEEGQSIGCGTCTSSMEFAGWSGGWMLESLMSVSGLGELNFISTGSASEGSALERKMPGH